MLNYNEIKEKKYIVLNGDPYEVLDSHVFRKQQRKPVNQTKLRHLLTGSINPHTFHNNDVVEEADISKEKYIFSFSKFNKQTETAEYWFYKKDAKKDRIKIEEEIIKNSIPYLKTDLEIDAMIFNGNIFGINLPIKMKLKVKDAPPAVKGNTSGGATKIIMLETGLKITVPLFINESDEIIINTETGEYVERA